MSRLEKSIECSVVEYARTLGVEAVKLNGMGKRSLPDRMFLAQGGVLFVEFKRPGAKPTPLQAHCHARWEKLGHHVYVVDNVEDGKALVAGLVL